MTQTNVYRIETDDDLAIITAVDEDAAARQFASHRAVFGESIKTAEDLMQRAHELGGRAMIDQLLATYRAHGKPIAYTITGNDYFYEVNDDGSGHLATRGASRSSTAPNDRTLKQYWQAAQACDQHQDKLGHYATLIARHHGGTVHDHRAAERRAEAAAAAAGLTH